MNGNRSQKVRHDVRQSAPAASGLQRIQAEPWQAVCRLNPAEHSTDSA
jgi:hypothetical protein